MKETQTPEINPQMIFYVWFLYMIEMTFQIIEGEMVLSYTEK